MAFGAIDPGIKIGSSNPGGANINMKNEVDKAYERYGLIQDLLKTAGDNKGLKLVDELIDKCKNYVIVTLKMEAGVKELEQRSVDIGEYKAEISRMDTNKRLAHNALISQLVIVNRYLSKKSPIKDQLLIGGIFSRNQAALSDPYSSISRAEIGDWASDLVTAIYRKGK